MDNMREVYPLSATMRESRPWTCTIRRLDTRLEAVTYRTPSLWTSFLTLMLTECHVKLIVNCQSVICFVSVKNYTKGLENMLYYS